LPYETILRINRLNSVAKRCDTRLEVLEDR